MSISRRAFLGAELPADEEAFSIDGLRVAGVIEGGMADRAGLTPGDTIVAIAGVPIRTLCDLALALRAAGEGREVVIASSRGERTVDVTHAPYEPGVSYGEHA